MKKASWIILTIVGVLTLALSVASAVNAYSTNDYLIGPARVSELGAGRPDVVSALRGIRGTAAAYAAAYGALFLTIVLGPYRRGEVWAWWVLLAGGLTQLAIALLRIPFLGTQLGVAAPALHFGPLIVGLLLDVGRLKGTAR